jgi:hypothetical protein
MLVDDDCFALLEQSDDEPTAEDEDLVHEAIEQYL